MDIVLRSVNFNYPDGGGGDFQSVNLSFNNNGETFNLDGYIQISKEQYEATSGDRNALVNLIKTNIADRLES